MLIPRRTLLAVFALTLSSSLTLPAKAGPIFLEGTPDPTAAQVPNRWIGTKAPGLADCPVPALGSWQTAPVFAKVSDGGGGGWIPTGLKDACLYENGDGVDHLEALYDNGLLSRLGPDLWTVVPAAPPSPLIPVLEPEIWRSLRDHFEGQAGKVPLTLLPEHTPPRVALLDTTPTRNFEPWEHPGLSRHGYTLFNMAESLLCATSTGDCIGQLTSQLALFYYVDRLDYGRVIRDPVGGGEFGSVVDLARAIQNEVLAWLDDDPESQLILNLSIGWDGLYGGLQLDPSDMPIAIELVYLALRDAACRGALTFAAAGNDVGGPDAGGLWLPAAWADRTVPNHTTCEALVDANLDPNDFPGQGFSMPLVQPVAGLRWDGKPLPNASRDSETPIAFYADHAVVESHIPNHPTEILTGSSVSTLLASVTAAAISYYWPDLPHFKIVDFLYETGRDLGRPADVCFGSLCTNNESANNVRWVGLCPALTAACSSSSLPCHTLPGCQTLGKSSPPLPFGLDILFDTTMPEEASALSLTSQHVPPQACEMLLQFFGPGLPFPIFPCPGRQLYSDLVRPWTRPAPESVPCPTCVYFQHSEVLLIEIDPSFTENLDEGTLQACGTSYHLPFPAPMTGGDRAVFRNLAVSPFCTAPLKLSFVVNGLSSSLDPILLIPYL